MTEIVSTVNELKEIDIEIKKKRELLTKLNKRKKELEKNIIKYLEQKDQSGLKYKDIAIIAEEKDKHIKLSKKDKTQKMKSILEKYGVKNTEMALKEITDNVKGEVLSKKILKIKDLK
jgi:hypothetical protein